MMKGIKSNFKVVSITAYNYNTVHESLHPSCCIYMFFTPKVYSVFMEELNVLCPIMLKERFSPPMLYNIVMKEFAVYLQSRDVMQRCLKLVTLDYSHVVSILLNIHTIDSVQRKVFIS